MFKKDLDVALSSQALLKNKEVKKLKKDLYQQLPALKEPELNELFTSSTQVSVAKLESRTLVYLIDNVPYIFDVEVCELGPLVASLSRYRQSHCLCGREGRFCFRHYTFYGGFQLHCDRYP
jgi:predicted ribosome-associated RNA-binding protein Tma20